MYVCICIMYTVFSGPLTVLNGRPWACKTEDCGTQKTFKGHFTANSFTLINTYIEKYIHTYKARTFLYN